MARLTGAKARTLFTATNTPSVIAIVISRCLPNIINPFGLLMEMSGKNFEEMRYFLRGYSKALIAR